ncbi:hypothetical protein [uncultured Lacinutrix sp.]|uniref:hypothetical protein n=1 Tax=uncultured Lacinutrix sp. TaxID=574032 RepID=UPI00263356CB|nr:hypothetical protein [uncultured Lacinutrix sp.]
MKNLFLLSILLFLLSCKTAQQKTVIKYLSLTSNEYKTIKKDKEVVNNLYFLIKDSVQTKKLSKALNLYLTGKDTRKQLIQAMEMYSVFGNDVEITDIKIDSTNNNYIKFKSLEELKAFEKKLTKGLEARGGNIRDLKKDTL